MHFNIIIFIFRTNQPERCWFLGHSLLICIAPSNNGYIFLSIFHTPKSSTSSLEYTYLENNTTTVKYVIWCEIPATKIKFPMGHTCIFTVALKTKICHNKLLVMPLCHHNHWFFQWPVHFYFSFLIKTEVRQKETKYIHN